MLEDRQIREWVKNLPPEHLKILADKCKDGTFNEMMSKIIQKLIIAKAITNEIRTILTPEFEIESTTITKYRLKNDWTVVTDEPHQHQTPKKPWYLRPFSALQEWWFNHDDI